jgi:two-component system sensor histidine kinase TctE
LFGEILDWMFAPLMLLWPLSVAVTFVVARSLTDAPFDRTLIDRVEVLRERITAGETDSRAQLLPLLERLARAQDGSTLRIQVAGPEGRIVAGDSGLARPGLYDFPAPERIRLRTVVDNGVEWRVAYTWASPSDLIENGLLLIQVADNFDNRDQLASEIIRGVLFPQFMILPLSLLLVWFGLSRGLAPMKLLQRKIQQRRRSTFVGHVQHLHFGGVTEHFAAHVRNRALTGSSIRN